MTNAGSIEIIPSRLFNMAFENKEKKHATPEISGIHKTRGVETPRF